LLPYYNGGSQHSKGTMMSNYSPHNGHKLNTYRSGDAHDVNAAVSSAKAAFVTWSALSGAQRGLLLQRAAELMREHSAELALLETLDAGIPISETSASHVSAAIAALQYYSGLASSLCQQGLMMDTPDAGGSSEAFCYTRREPLGVCAGIGPWNFPLLIMMWKVAPALACGNTFVFKPSECTPMTALRVAEIFTEAGIPEGVLNIIPGGKQRGKGEVTK
jgi:betaine-aldehyde dehydrogenase